jgi:hypothetical protein
LSKESLTLDGVVIENKSKDGLFHTAAKPLTLPATFVAQIQNVLASLAGNERLIVSGEEAVKSIQLIETCYGKRTLIEMPWLASDELVRARSLGSGNAAC